MDRRIRSAFTRKVKEATFPKVSPGSITFVLGGVVWRFAVQCLFRSCFLSVQITCALCDVQ